MAIEDTINTYEYKLKQAGVPEPLSSYLSDPLDADRLKAGFVSPVLDSSGNFVGITAYQQTFALGTVGEGSSDGVTVIFPDQSAVIYGYDGGGNLITETIQQYGFTWVKTYTWAGSSLINISVWVKQ